jgi:hypothetical protein
MAFETTGVIHAIFPTESRSEKFTSRDFVLEIPDGNYPQLIKFQAVQERCGLLDHHAEGDTVTVHFALRGREWNGKYLTNLNAWKIVGANGEKRATLPPPQAEYKDAGVPSGIAQTVPPPVNTAVTANHENPDDLPF